jgi:hypothetical protein
MHCIWPFFQYSRDAFNETAMGRLDELLSLAEAEGLDVVLTGLVGFMSGFHFMPFFSHKQHQEKEEVFSSTYMIEAEKNYFKKLFAVAGSHENFLGFDLGNELNCLGDFGYCADTKTLDMWNEEMQRFLEELCPDKIRVSGVDHIPWFTNTSFSRNRLANTGSMTSLHTWLGFTGALARFGYDSLGTYCFPEYCIELARAYADDPDRMSWIQEFGASIDWMPREHIPIFMEKTLKHICSCENVWGVTWWCSHDVNTSLSEFNHLEYDLGLFDINNKPKPEAQKLKELIKRLKLDPPEPAKRTVALVVDETMFGPSAEGPDYTSWKIGDAFVRLKGHGVDPAFVHRSRVSDEEYLKRRGITSLMEI